MVATLNLSRCQRKLATRANATQAQPDGATDSVTPGRLQHLRSSAYCCVKTVCSQFSLIIIEVLIYHVYKAPLKSADRQDALKDFIYYYSAARWGSLADI